MVTAKVALAAVAAGLACSSAAAFQATLPLTTRTAISAYRLTGASRAHNVVRSSPRILDVKALFQQSSLTKFKVAPLKAITANAGSQEKPSKNLLVLALYFAAWYALNVGYNISNKMVLNAFPLYATTAVIQLLVAWIWLLPQWALGIRPVPKPSESNMKALQKVSLLHGFGHLVTVLSMGLGSVSFVHVVKAAEPVFAAALSAIFAGSIMAAPVYLSLLPVCAGVAIASAGELAFSWACFGSAMMSNLLFASRAVFSKIAMSGKDQGENMDSANTFAVVTMLATIVCLPVALLLEGPKIQAAWAAATVAKGMTASKLVTHMALSGFYLYTYNEFAFKVLGLVSPVAQAVGNTVKRVVILVATSFAFATPMTPIGIAGSTIAMVGVLVYSLVQQAYDKKK